MLLAFFSYELIRACACQPPPSICGPFGSHQHSSHRTPGSFKPWSPAWEMDAPLFISCPTLQLAEVHRDPSQKVLFIPTTFLIIFLFCFWSHTSRANPNGEKRRSGGGSPTTEALLPLLRQYQVIESLPPTCTGSLLGTVLGHFSCKLEPDWSFGDIIMPCKF